MADPAALLPTGTVTCLFTDIEGSTKLLQELGDEYPRVLEVHQTLVRKAAADAGGVEVDTQGDAFFLVFTTPTDAAEAAIAAQRALFSYEWPAGAEVRVRMGIHTGVATAHGRMLAGLDVHRAARMAAAGHGGQILVSEATHALLQDKLPNDVEFRDLGHHRLKDLPSPEHLFQLVVPGLPSTFPPLRSLEARHNLPVQLTSFVGRQRETAQIRELLKDTRLLTLCGPGGSGKTRLAIQVAGEVMHDFRDGVFLVALASVRDPALVPATIADALGVTVTTRPVLEVLEEYLATRELLLVLDNFEHLMTAAPLIGRLLQAAEQLRVLVTSRARLHVLGEQALAIPPMDVPEPGHLPSAQEIFRYDALGLFVQRARAADPAFAFTDENVAVVSEICIRLDGLPLAIELAAARLDVLTPKLLLERLQRRLPLLTSGPMDASDRQRTLAGTIAWSHALLAPADQALFRRLSVFSGGCTIQAAEAVIGGDQLDVLNGLSSLVEKSLVRRVPERDNEPRFRMLETIREYARDRLVESGENELMEERHAQFYRQLAEEAEKYLTAVATCDVVTRVQLEQDNLRAVMERSIRTGDATTGLAIASAIWRFWQHRGQLAEGRQWMTRLLALPTAADLGPARAKALSAAAGMAYWQGDYAAAASLYSESLAVAREVGDRAGAAEALRSLGYLAGIGGEYGRAHELHGQSRALSAEIGDTRGVAYDLVGDGMILHIEGHTDEAQAVFEQASALFEEVGEGYGLATVLCLLSRILVERGEVDAATVRWSRAFELLRELHDSSGLIIALSDLCAIELARGRVADAVTLAGAADGLGDALKLRPPTALTQPPDPRLAARSVLGGEAEDAWRAGRAMTLDEAVEFARALTRVRHSAPAQR